VQYGFVINHETCIGCHACTTACKAENHVPVGHFRTAVKYIEVGAFPKVRRHFLVQRCNHCTNAPCVTICPVNALSKRPDGIVDVDRDACIGCRACMQACPYDALYVNEDLGAVEKCHFCAHRIDKGLSPACVNVCPVGAIVPGDLHDPDSPASRLKAQHETRARRLEQKTGPNVHYVGAHELALEPGMIERPEMYLWSDRPPQKPEAWPSSLPLAKDARVVLDAGHKVEWGWPVALYLVTKNVAAGAALVAPFLGMMGVQIFGYQTVPEMASLAFTLVTLFLLVEDLKKPLHFFKLFTRPNMKSWLVKGGLILTAFFLMTAGIWLIEYMGPSVGDQDVVDRFLQAFRWLNFPLALAAAGYTAFLFAQCKGRDLWEHKLLLPSLLAGAALCGGLFASLALAGRGAGDVGAVLFSVGIGFAAVGFGYLHHRMTHGRQASNNALQAAAFAREARIGGIKIEPFANRIVVAGAFFAAIAIFIPAAAPLAYIGAPISLVGVFLLESVFVRAGQLPPLS
jgi:Fe-S-cluster-containing dehydrogenase component/formate-dependent nitrite reductase membrane component NrfD